MRRWLCLAATIVAAACATSGPAAPAPASNAIDVVDFLVGDPALWPRLGSATMHQVVDLARREVCWVKYFNARTFECWRWDDRFIYHVVDHAIDGNTGESYSFSDGRWMPRYLDGVWTLTVENRIDWFDSACRPQPSRSGGFRYRQRVWHDVARDLGGSLGVRDIVVLEYAPEDPAGGPTQPEQFHFARGAGWYQWQRVNLASTLRVFNTRGDFVHPVAARETVCGGK